MKKCMVIAIMCMLISAHVWGSLGIAGEKEIFLVTTDIDSRLNHMGILVFTEAFKRHGYGLRVEESSQLGCIKKVNSERADGDMTRIYDFVKGGAHPNYYRIEEPFYFIRWSVFAIKQGIVINSWQDLKTDNYRVGYLAGVAKSEQNLIGFINNNKLVVVPNNDEQGYEMLRKNRFDVYVQADEDLGFKVLKQEKFQASGIRKVGVAEELGIYCYLHKKHKDLADTITKTIQKMKAEGLFDKYLEQLDQEDAAK